MSAVLVPRRKKPQAVVKSKLKNIYEREKSEDFSPLSRVLMKNYGFDENDRAGYDIRTMKDISQTYRRKIADIRLRSTK